MRGENATLARPSASSRNLRRRRCGCRNATHRLRRLQPSADRGRRPAAAGALARTFAPYATLRLRDASSQLKKEMIRRLRYKDEKLRRSRSRLFYREGALSSARRARTIPSSTPRPTPPLATRPPPRPPRPPLPLPRPRPRAKWISLHLARSRHVSKPSAPLWHPSVDAQPPHSLSTFPWSSRQLTSHQG